MDRLQNRRFVRGFRRFSWHVTKCHACHGIGTLSPLRAALTMWFAKNMQHDTSKVLPMPRKMKSEMSKVLRLPRKMQHIFWKYRKSIAPATQNDFWCVLKHDGMPRSATPVTQNDMTTSSDTSKKSRFCDFSILFPQTDGCKRLGTVADGCERLRTPEAGSREHGSTPRPPNVKREPFATHSGKTMRSPGFVHGVDAGSIGLLLVVIFLQLNLATFKRLADLLPQEREVRVGHTPSWVVDQMVLGQPVPRKSQISWIDHPNH